MTRLDDGARVRIVAGYHDGERGIIFADMEEDGYCVELAGTGNIVTVKDSEVGKEGPSETVIFAAIRAAIRENPGGGLYLDHAAARELLDMIK